MVINLEVTASERKKETERNDASLSVLLLWVTPIQKHTRALYKDVSIVTKAIQSASYWVQLLCPARTQNKDVHFLSIMSTMILTVTPVQHLHR